MEYVYTEWGNPQFCLKKTVFYCTLRAILTIVWPISIILVSKCMYFSWDFIGDSCTHCHTLLHTLSHTLTQVSHTLGIFDNFLANFYRYVLELLNSLAKFSYALTHSLIHSHTLFIHLGLFWQFFGQFP